MNGPSVHSHASRLHAASDPRALRSTLARLLLLALPLGILGAYCIVLQAGVQRGEQLNRQMADAASRCDTAAGRQRPLKCIRPAAADTSHSRPGDRQQLAAR